MPAISLDLSAVALAKEDPGDWRSAECWVRVFAGFQLTAIPAISLDPGDWRSAECRFLNPECCIHILGCDLEVCARCGRQLIDHGRPARSDRREKASASENFQEVSRFVGLLPEQPRLLVTELQRGDRLDRCENEPTRRVRREKRA
jgi:hypothetical protein